MASKCDEYSFCSDYMLLKPEEAGLVDIFRILFSNDIAKRKFIDCSNEKQQEPFERRWLIFVSILVQKVLHALEKPMSWLGWLVEEWLNLLSSNSGLSGLVHNFLQGKVIHPEKMEENFVSIVGHTDKRRDLDMNIKLEDGRYYAALSVMAAKLSYENKAYIESTIIDHWEMDFLGSYDFWNDYQEKATTQAFMFADKNDRIVVAFRGTEPFDANAWSTDFDFSWYGIEGLGKAHGGFMKALGLQKKCGWPRELAADNQHQFAYYTIRKMLKQLLQKNEKAKFIVTGHSLGGALAILFPAILALHEETWLLQRLDGIYTFGQPRVGDEQFGELLNAQLTKYDVDYYRIVYSFDIVPRLPYDDAIFLFKHCGKCVYFNSFYQGKILAEEPNKNYFSLKWVIPKIINALWELIRSFVIPYIKGAEYKEEGLLRFLRFIGLLTAGLSAHCPQDYVNATRLGPSNLYLN